MNTYLVLSSDFEERYHRQPRGLIDLVASALRTREFAAVFLYRVHVALDGKRRFIPGLRAVLYHVLRSSYGVDIHPKAIIGPGMMVHHAHMIVIGDGVIIGSGFHVYHGVTIGAKNQFALDAYPSIGNNVTIYPGSVVAGNISIGDNVVIGANSLVLDDVPSDSIVYTQAAVSKKHGIQG